MAGKQFILCLCIFALSFDTTVSEECPPPEEKNTCTCEYHDGIVIKCDDDTPEKLYQALESLSSHKVKIQLIFLTNHAIKKLKPNLFGNATVVEVAIYMKNLTEVDPDAFMGQENSLEDVFFTHSQLEEIPSKSISILARLKVFRYLFAMKTKVIGSNAFINQVEKNSVEKLIFLFNGIESIEKGAFTPLVALKLVSFYSNPLKSIDPASFPLGPNQLRQLLIEKGSLQKIPHGVLATLPDFAEVNLSENDIVNLSKEDIALLLKKQLNINLDGNNLNCSCAFKLFAESPLRLASGVCSEPSKRKAKELIELIVEDFSDC